MAHTGTEEMSCAFPCSLFFLAPKASAWRGTLRRWAGPFPWGPDSRHENTRLLCNPNLLVGQAPGRVPLRRVFPFPAPDTDTNPLEACVCVWPHAGQPGSGRGSPWRLCECQDACVHALLLLCPQAQRAALNAG